MLAMLEPLSLLGGSSNVIAPRTQANLAGFHVDWGMVRSQKLTARLALFSLVRHSCPIRRERAEA